MFKTIKDDVWAYDAEWVPDANAGRLLYDLPEDTPEAAVIKHMWCQNGASEETPQPFLKLVLCRVVSIASPSHASKNRNPSSRAAAPSTRGRFPH